MRVFFGGVWRRLNEYVCLKLSLVNEIVAEIPLLQMMQEEGLDERDGENFTQQQSSIVASLALIGTDDARYSLHTLQNRHRIRMWIHESKN